MHLCSRNFCAGGLAAAVALFMSAGPAFSEKVGVTAAVNPTVTGLPPGGSMRELRIGADVVHNERIRSSGGGSMQLVFVDKTTLTISPNADITINEFVYNPGARSGNMAVTVTKGLMRFVGGQVSHSGQAQITTPTAVMGIRGGMGMVNSANGKTTVVPLYGAITVTTGSNSVTITKPGYYVEAGGGQVSPPKPAPPGLITAYNAQLQSKPGQTGGTNRGLLTADKYKNLVNGSPDGSNQSSNDQRYRPDNNPQPPTTPTSFTANTGGVSPGGGVGGGVGGPSGPAWGQLTAPGLNGGRIPGVPPGQELKGIKGRGNN
jgi:hypothetical protein